jgi:HlyD family secretion protein
MRCWRSARRPWPTSNWPRRRWNARRPRLAEREDALAKTVVRAPIDGVVGGRAAEVGMQVSPGAPLFTLGNPARVIVRVNLTDIHLRRITVGMPVRILPEGGGIEPLVGVIGRLSPFLDTANRTAVAEIDLVNPTGRLWPGMFVPVDVLYGQSRQSTLIPTSALFTDPNTGREGVFRLAAPPVTPDTGLTEPIEVSFLPISPLARGEHEVAVENLDAGAWIVTLGQNLLATGRGQARVRAVTWDHVMHLQGLHRDELLAEVLRDAPTRPNLN